MLVFIVGGIKSGKTEFAVKLALKENKRRIYFATAVPLDENMKRKIKEHRKKRQRKFLTIEEATDLKKSLFKNSVVVVDCINFWLRNMLELNKSRSYILNYIKNWIKKAKSLNSTFIVISNEVGMGLVSEFPSGKLFQEVLGEINCSIAKSSDMVYHMVCGIPLKVKNENYS